MITRVALIIYFIFRALMYFHIMAVPDVVLGVTALVVIFGLIFTDLDLKPFVIRR